MQVRRDAPAHCAPCLDGNGQVFSGHTRPPPHASSMSVSFEAVATPSDGRAPRALPRASCQGQRLGKSPHPARVPRAPRADTHRNRPAHQLKAIVFQSLCIPARAPHPRAPRIPARPAPTATAPRFIPRPCSHRLSKSLHPRARPASPRAPWSTHLHRASSQVHRL